MSAAAAPGSPPRCPSPPARPSPWPTSRTRSPPRRWCATSTSGATTSRASTCSSPTWPASSACSTRPAPRPCPTGRDAGEEGREASGEGREASEEDREAGKEVSMLREYARLAAPYFVALGIVTAGRWVQGTVFRVPYDQGTHVFSIVTLTLFASLFSAMFLRRWQGFRLGRAAGFAVFMAVVSQLVIWLSTIASY